jgi:hypothetical protein
MFGGRKGEKVSNLIHYERVKLQATFLNTIAAATFLGAILIPTRGQVQRQNDHAQPPATVKIIR